ncbi:MAG: hypothetical protein QXT13_10175 [Pyrobaculum sp.]
MVLTIFIAAVVVYIVLTKNRKLQRVVSDVAGLAVTLGLAGVAWVMLIEAMVLRGFGDILYPLFWLEVPAFREGLILTALGAFLFIILPLIPSSVSIPKPPIGLGRKDVVLHSRGLRRKRLEDVVCGREKSA